MAGSVIEIYMVEKDRPGIHVESHCWENDKGEKKENARIKLTNHKSDIELELSIPKEEVKLILDLREKLSQIGSTEGVS